ncbi:EamA/RhaT family transporter [Nitrincola tibetensis]|uniref:EamA/RhaT family transporter n=2 Tax=Nitrincola tibetensis TaxID=2219697 RepID=A0A364NQE7_9GAMM|nr:EamA/RhaT family transporter [Nitrincola tibetensis]
MGAALIVASEIFLVTSGIFVRQLGDGLPLEVIVLMRNLLGLVWLMPWILRRGREELPTSRLHLHFMRSLIGVSAMTCLFYAWTHLPLAQAAMLKQMAPFFVPIIALWWLKESIDPALKWAIIVGFAGVGFILQPDEGVINHAVLVGLLAAVLGATAKVSVRTMRSSESPQKIVFYFAFFGSLLAAVPAALNWMTPTPVQWMWLVGLAASSTLAQLLLSRAYGMAPAGQLGPFTYSSVIFAALMGWLLWDEQLNIYTFAGISLVCIAGFMTLRKRRHTS